MTNPTTTATLTADEFLAQPETMLPHELIDGEEIMSPAPEINHQLLVGNLWHLIRTQTPDGLTLLAPCDVRWDDGNVTQPDVFWVSAHNAQCHSVEGKYWQGPPDLIIEVLSPRTALHDKQVKFRLYEAHGVREYWIADPEHRLIEVWSLHEGRFALQAVYGAAGELVSPVLEGKVLALAGIFPE